MKIFLSHLLNEDNPSYGDRDKLNIINKSKIINDIGANTSSWVFSNNHMGTHIDTPNHFYNNGKKTIDYKADEFFFNTISLIERKCDNGILLNHSDIDFSGVDSETDLLIIKTFYEDFRNDSKYHNDNPGLHSDLAAFLRFKFNKLRGIGFDFISLTSWNYRDEGKISHKSFLSQERPILIIEDMKLSDVNSNTDFKEIIVSPLRVSDGNGGPVTIFAEIND